MCVCVYSPVFKRGTLFVYVQTGDNLKEKQYTANCLSKVLCHFVPPEQLQCALALILQVSGMPVERWNTILPNYIFTFGVLVRSDDKKAVGYDSHNFHTHRISHWPLVLYGWEHCYSGRHHSHQNINVSSKDEGDHQNFALMWSGPSH